MTDTPQFFNKHIILLEQQLEAAEKSVRRISLALENARLAHKARNLVPIDMAHIRRHGGAGTFDYPFASFTGWKTSPLPEGFEIMVMFADGEVLELKGEQIIADIDWPRVRIYMITGLKDGYCLADPRPAKQTRAPGAALDLFLPLPPSSLEIEVRD